MHNPLILLVDELRNGYCVCGIKGIVRGQVVIFPGVEDDAAVTDDDSGEELVDECPLHVDISEEDAIEGIVEQHVQSFHGTHGSDLRHAHAGGVVAKSHILAVLFPHPIQRFTHDPEVFLSSIGSAKAFCSGTVGHIVQKALGCGADNGNDIRPLAGCRLCLDHIFVDVSCGNDDVEVGLPPLADGEIGRAHV